MLSSSCTTDTTEDTPYLFVTCGMSLEPLLQEELQELGYNDLRLGFRGVYVYHPEKTALYHINYASRIASRVLLPLKKFNCLNKNDLYEQAKQMEWSYFIPRGKTFAIDANVTHPRLRNSLFAAQVMKDAICDQLREKRGERPSIDPKEPDVQLNLFIRGKAAIISFDTSGDPLHKRGYRKQSVEAPIQESLAAALLKMAQYKGDEILLDPCCGSGTLLIEAALIASSTPPGYLRKKWGFQQLPEYSEELFETIRNQENSKRKPLAPNHFVGLDKEETATFAAKENVKAAGFQGIIEIIRTNFRVFPPKILPSFIISNPPHGKRLESIDDLRATYRALGDFMKTKSAHPAKGYIFTTSLELAKEVGLAPKRRHVLKAGGLESRFLEYDLY